MRICVIGTRGFPFVEGGVEKHCESIYPLLAKNAEIVVFRRRPYVRYGTQAYDNVRFVDLPSTRIKGFEALVHSFLATICAIKMRPDMVHFHNIGPALFAPIVKMFSIPVVLTYHSANYEHKKWGYLASNLLRFCEKVALRYSDRILFVNRFQMQKYPETIKNKSVYIPNGMNAPVIPQKCDYLEKIGVEPGKYILSVGRITPEKGFHTLINAFKTYKLDGYKLVIAGGVEFENSYMDQLQTLAQNTPVIFTGYVFGDALSQLYANTALFVLTSENEGFPLVLLEAMSFQRNVLVSDIPATRLVKLEADDYFPVGDTTTLGEKMIEKLSSASVRTYDLTEYDWPNIAEQVSAIFEEMCN